ncbi:CD63 antigen-like [Stegodyphus dumicola]|uniref:CD63 antigen-like n=1 Tax=Stegodyphus dumicola TaxID=202533 RepID=UPI0015AAD800|nr:CD63 antigen-like [Stegodyphus dumicola]
MQAGMSCIKYLMFVFNFIFVVCGIALIAIGAVVINTKDFTVFLDSKYVTAPTILIIVGCIIFVVAFLGCCGAVKENHCMVMTFGILLFIIFVIEIAGGIAAYVNRSGFEDFLKANMNSSIEQQKKDAIKIWDEIQTKWHCCGVDDASDYIKNDVNISQSCCKPEIMLTCTEDLAYKKGCFKEMYEHIKGIIGKVGGVAIGIAVVELIGVIFAWCLASAIKKEYEGV